MPFLLPRGFLIYELRLTIADDLPRQTTVLDTPPTAVAADETADLAALEIDELDIPNTTPVPFCSKMQWTGGRNLWYESNSQHKLESPPSIATNLHIPDVLPSAGDIYIHRNIREALTQTWMRVEVHGNFEWRVVVLGRPTPHPLNDDKVLNPFRLDKRPNWVTWGRYCAIISLLRKRAECSRNALCQYKSTAIFASSSLMLIAVIEPVTKLPIGYSFAFEPCNINLFDYSSELEFVLYTSAYQSFVFAL